MAAARQVRLLGTTDETDACECCGRRGLKRVIVLDVEGEIVRYGRDCAAKALTRHPSNRHKGAVNAANLWNEALWANSCRPDYRPEARLFVTAAD